MLLCIPTGTLQKVPVHSRSAAFIPHPMFSHSKPPLLLVGRCCVRQGTNAAAQTQDKQHKERHSVQETNRKQTHVQTAAQGKHKEGAAAQTKKQPIPRRQTNKDAAGSVPWPPKRQGQWLNELQTTTPCDTLHPIRSPYAKAPLVGGLNCNMAMHPPFLPGPPCLTPPSLLPTCPELNEGKILVPVHVNVHNRLACTAQHSRASHASASCFQLPCELHAL